jgi:hypothetical protein
MCALGCISVCRFVCARVRVCNGPRFVPQGVSLSVKIGIGIGRVSVLHLGGALGRMEYVAVGEPLVQVRAGRACVCGCVCVGGGYAYA